MEATISTKKTLMGKVPGYTITDIRDFPTQADLKEYGFSERMCAYQCQNKNQPERVDLHVMAGSCNDEVLHIDDWYRVDVFEELMSTLGAIMTEWYISKHRIEAEAKKHNGVQLFTFSSPYEVD
ncbi:hypothetical protein [Mesotoga prima]|uniref:hypothetical protein n=1 Tax=Mesotoga prima TaxID=1184387 RepID=UPI002FDB3637